MKFEDCVAANETVDQRKASPFVTIWYWTEEIRTDGDLCLLSFSNKVSVLHSIFMASPVIDTFDKQ